MIPIYVGQIFDTDSCRQGEILKKKKEDKKSWRGCRREG